MRKTILYKSPDTANEKVNKKTENEGIKENTNSLNEEKRKKYSEEEKVNTESITHNNNSKNESRSKIYKSESNNNLSVDSSKDSQLITILDQSILKQTNNAISESDEKKLNRYLKITHLIGEKKIQQQVLINEEVKLISNNLASTLYQDSDEEESVIKIIKEIDKQNLIQNDIFFLNSEQIRFRSSNKIFKKKKNHVKGLEDLRIMPKKSNILNKKANKENKDKNNHNDSSNDDDTDDNNYCINADLEINNAMDLDAYYNKLNKSKETPNKDEDTNCLLF